MDTNGIKRASELCKAQGAFYVATGIWPILSRRTFEAVTGPKKDFWLVKTVGVMFTVIGGALLVAGQRKRVTPEIAGLGAATAAGFVALDAWYVSRGRIAPIYLLDAVIQAALLARWSAVQSAVGEHERAESAHSPAASTSSDLQRGRRSPAAVTTGSAS